MEYEQIKLELQKLDLESDRQKMEAETEDQQRKAESDDKDKDIMHDLIRRRLFEQ